MAKFYIKKASIQKVMRGMEAAGAKVQRRMIYALVVWADDTVAEIKAEFRRINAVDTGELMASVSRTAPRRVGKSKIRIIVFSPKEYAAIVEFGRRARAGKPPPLLPLVGWAKRKGIVKLLPVNISFDGKWAKKWAASAVIWKNSRKSGGRRARGKRKPIDPVVREMLIIRALREAIYTRGIKARRPMTRIFERRVKTVKRDIVRFANAQP